MNQESNENIIKWINTKCPNLKCECCQLEEWSIVDLPLKPMEIIHTKDLVKWAPKTSFVMLECDNCGNTKLFNMQKIVK